MERCKQVEMRDEMRDLTGQKGTSQMDLISSYPMLPLAPNIATVAILSRAKTSTRLWGSLDQNLALCALWSKSEMCFESDLDHGDLFDLAPAGGAESLSRERWWRKR